MNDLKEYVTNLNYDYAETYSGLRGPMFQNIQLKIKEQILNEEKRIEKARFMEIQTISKGIVNLKSSIDLSKSRLVNSNGNKHESAELICNLKRHDLKLEQILESLSIKYKSHGAWMCAPVFRDSIVFYKENIIKGLINICFGCESIVNENGQCFLADSEIYPILKKQFIELGHKIGTE